MAGNGEIFRRQIIESQESNLGIITTPTYFDAQMTRAAANKASWAEFRDGMRPLGMVSVENSDLEFLVTPKAAPWGMEDVNIFAGSASREIVEIDDFESGEGQAFLRVNFSLVESLFAKGHCSSAQVTVGFNRNDLSIGHHTVRKLHSHVRVTPNPLDMPRRSRRSWDSMERFDKLAFTEPFAPLFQDFIEHATQSGAFDRLLVHGPYARRGYTTMELRRFDLHRAFDNLSNLYRDMRKEFEIIESIFTDGQLNQITNRPVPRPKEERYARLESFLAARNGFYSADSVKALSYLAANIHEAVPRAPGKETDLATTSKMYLTKGFAGALVFGFNKDEDTVRFDFLPVVLSTSSVTRTLMGESLPTVVLRVPEPASYFERQMYRRYCSTVVNVLEEIMPPGQFRPMIEHSPLA